ncbi:phosphoribosyltransferase family protein [Neobacillus mesonae]|uniref:phosphoribosyltransferase family protein n=1 Tax=Neobacillus mesonae TaxID=1193713 RepID=UPI00203A8949|nr:phosphoribosyltransferase family protein [Neobacillus mesonae]MCM3566878.1 phosphoribosyltransferase family protein [Neobacillus mesonae]
MNNTQTSTLSKKKYVFHILNSLDVEINVLDNPYELPIEDLFTMAARINKKRSFLFVSKVLGKHIPINPEKGLLTGALLAARFLERVKGITYKERDLLLKQYNQKIDGSNRLPEPFVPSKFNPVIIGFAETATALGHCFFEFFQNASFFHTTREVLFGSTPSITFEEEHSHATSHRCYISEDMINNEREIILVDDEITTGKTALNIIKSIHRKFPRKEYTIVSILDWRSDESRNQFAEVEKNLDIKINGVSLLSGNVRINQTKELKEGYLESEEKCQEIMAETIDLSSFFTDTSYTSISGNIKYIQETGRFGLNSIENEAIRQKASKAAAYLKEKRKGKRTLCLGTGEFMYLPMKIASEMGLGVFYQSTTRSPIFIENLEGYGARYGMSFPNPDEPSIRNFVYNIEPGYYDELFLFFEREVELKNLEPFLKAWKKTKIDSVKLVFCSRKRGEYHDYCNSR